AAALFARELAGEILRRGMPPDTLLNVNVPKGRPRGVRVTHQGKRLYPGRVIERKDPKGRTYYWIGGAPAPWDGGAASDFCARAFLTTPAHPFVNEALCGRAYGDTPLPIGWGQSLSQPYMIARMIQLLGLRPGDKVLEVGTGSGCQTAFLARLAGAVYTIERLEPLARRARENWRHAAVSHVRARVGDGSLGWPSEAPFAA